MHRYYDTHNKEIKAGMFLRCLTNNEIIKVFNEGNDLGFFGFSLDGEQSFHSLICFCWAYFVDERLHLIDFEIKE
jgi:hypothetical protein